MNYSDRIFEFENLFSSDLLKVDIGDIFQVSELSVIQGGEISTHRQRCDEITYAISGRACFVSDNERLEVGAGQIHFIKSGHTHKIEVSQGENFRFICIGFIPNNDNRYVKEFYNKCKAQSYFVVDDNGMVKNLSEFLIREFYNYDEFSNDMVNCYISQILTMLTRILCNRGFVYSKSFDKKSANVAMYKMLRYIDREYLQIASVKEISNALSYSQYYLSHLFKEKMGITVKKYILKKKIEHSKELLQQGELAVEQIAEQINFSSPHSFRRAFKQCTGLSPREYKNKTANFVPLYNTKTY